MSLVSVFCVDCRHEQKIELNDVEDGDETYCFGCGAAFAWSYDVRRAITPKGATLGKKAIRS